MFDLCLFITNFINFYIIVPFIFLLGLFLTFRLRALQVRGLKMSLKYLLKQTSSNSEKKTNSISRLTLMASVLSGNLGTGTITGMSVALTTGGPGALVWMWGVTFVGAIVQFASSFLGIKYKIKLETGESVSGPMCYLLKGLNLKFLSIAFCFFTILTACFAGNVLQVNTLLHLCSGSIFSKWLFGLLLIFPVGLVISGGYRKIVKFSAKLISVVGICYLLSLLYILFYNYNEILPTLFLIFKSAFGIKAAIGGIGGFTFFHVLSTGASRAIMAADSGNGMVSILQSDSKTSNPIVDGLVTLFPSLIVMILCSLTALSLMVSGGLQSGLIGSKMVLYVFSKVLGEKLGFSIVFLATALFGYTTILAWFACADKALLFLSNKNKWKFLLRYVYLALLPLSAFVDVKLIWVFSDLAFIGMVVINLIGITGLTKEIYLQKESFSSLVK